MREFCCLISTMPSCMDDSSAAESDLESEGEATSHTGSPTNLRRSIDSDRASDGPLRRSLRSNHSSTDASSGGRPSDRASVEAAAAEVGGRASPANFGP